MAAGIDLATAYVSLSISGQDIAPQARQQLRGVETEADRAGKASGKKFSAGMGGAVKSLGPLLGGVLAGIGFGAVVSGLKDVVGEAREAQKVGALTANVIKTTGGAAKISAKQVGDLSEAISNKTGIDDEAVQTGANLLLTFKNVRNEAGKGSDVFNRATKSAVDLSASGFGSVESSSKMLGKALNDPLKGISALSRAGVTFTAGQKKQIEGMVKAGDVLGAQKIILKEVESQVGGSAAASATAGEKVSVAFGNIKESLGAKLLPLLDKFGIWFLEKGLPAIQRFGGWLTENLWPALKEGYATIMPGLSKALEIVTGGVGDGSFSFEKLGKIITEKVIPFVAELMNVYLPYVAAQMRAVIEVIKVLWRSFEIWRDIVATATSVIVRTFLGLVSAIINGAAKAFGWVPGLGGKLKTAATEFDKFKNNVNSALDGIKDKQVTVGVKMVAGSRAVLSEKSSGGGRNTGGGSTKFAGGGVLPGWSPGRDVHQFYSPTGGRLDLSGGESIMRPEFTRLVGGKSGVDRLNALARKGVGPAQAFAGGGVYAATRIPSRRGIDEGVDSATLSLVAANARQLQALIAPTASGGPGMGYKAQAAWARANIPGVIITSTLRSGNPLSDHDKGRAIDLAGGPGLSRIFDIIKGAFGVSAIRSLYYSPKGNRQVRFNRESNTPAHIYGTHFDHNHWAMKDGGIVPSLKPTLMDRGGVIQPGLNLIRNDLSHAETVIPRAPGDLIDYDQLGSVLASRIDGMRVVADGREIGRIATKYQDEESRNGKKRRG